MICSKCGANNLEGQTFCGNCGSPLGNSTSTFVDSQDHYQKEERSFTISQNNPSNGGIIRPKSYQTEAIIVTVVSMLCCGSLPSLIIGIFAILKAGKVEADFASGRINDAIQNSESAKKLTIWAGVIAVIWTILATIIYFVVFAALYAGGLEELLNS